MPIKLDRDNMMIFKEKILNNNSPGCMCMSQTLVNKTFHLFSIILSKYHSWKNWEKSSVFCGSEEEAWWRKVFEVFLSSKTY